MEPRVSHPLGVTQNTSNRPEPVYVTAKFTSSLPPIPATHSIHGQPIDSETLRA